MAACSLARKCVHCHIALTGNSLIFNSESVYIVSSKLLVMCRTAMEVKLCPILCKVRGDFVQCPKNDFSWRPSAILLWFIFSANSAYNVWRVCKSHLCKCVSCYDSDFQQIQQIMFGEYAKMSCWEYTSERKCWEFAGVRECAKITFWEYAGGQEYAGAPDGGASSINLVPKPTAWLLLAHTFHDLNFFLWFNI